MGCVVCDDAVRAALREGVEPPIEPGGFIPHPASKGVVYEGNCARCEARGRTRALATLLLRGQYFIRPSARVLLVSANEHQLPLFRAHFTRLTHVSLYGDHGDPDCILGVDVNDLSRFPPRGFMHVFAICVLDFIPTPWTVFAQLHRVMKRGGTAFFYIQPTRLGDFAEPVTVKHRNALKHEDYAPKGAETGIPHCLFDRKSLVRFMQDAGFAVDILAVKDHLSDLRFTYFIARA